MDSYIVRIYRRDQGSNHKMLGVVAGISGNDDQLFDSAEKLWSILRKAPGAANEPETQAGNADEKCEFTD